MNSADETGSGLKLVPTEVLRYHRGAWDRTTVTFPGGAKNWDAAMCTAGWESGSFGDFGSETAGGMWFRLWQQRNADMHLIHGFLIEISDGFGSDWVVAGDIADAMDLLSRWAPIAKFAMLANFMAAIQADRSDTLEQMAAALARGWNR